MRAKYDFVTQRVNDDGSASGDKTLDAWGEDGYSLVSVVFDPDGTSYPFVAFLQRRVEYDSERDDSGEYYEVISDPT